MMVINYEGNGDWMEQFKIGDKVINMGLKGIIVDIRQADDISGQPLCYLVKYPLFTFKNPFKRKLWTFGFGMKKIKDDKNE